MLRAPRCALSAAARSRRARRDGFRAATFEMGHSVSRYVDLFMVIHGRHKRQTKTVRVCPTLGVGGPRLPVRYKPRGQSTATLIVTFSNQTHAHPPMRHRRIDIYFFRSAAEVAVGTSIISRPVLKAVDWYKGGASRVPSEKPWLGVFSSTSDSRLRGPSRGSRRGESSLFFRGGGSYGARAGSPHH